MFITEVGFLTMTTPKGPETLRNFSWRVDVPSRGKSMEKSADPVLIAQFVTGPKVSDPLDKSGCSELTVELDATSLSVLKAAVHSVHQRIQKEYS